LAQARQIVQAVRVGLRIETAARADYDGQVLHGSE
jgi:hypothetical protein